MVLKHAYPYTLCTPFLLSSLSSYPPLLTFSESTLKSSPLWLPHQWWSGYTTETAPTTPCSLSTTTSSTPTPSSTVTLGWGGRKTGKKEEEEWRWNTAGGQALWNCHKKWPILGCQPTQVSQKPWQTWLLGPHVPLGPRVPTSCPPMSERLQNSFIILCGILNLLWTFV